MTQPTPILKLMKKLEDDVVRAFVRSMQKLAGSVDMGRFVELIGQGRIDDALKFLELGPEHLGPLNEELRGAYLRSGEELADALPPLLDPALGGTVTSSFNAENTRAQQYLRQSSARRVTHLTDLERSNLREFLSDQLNRGKSPRTVALNLVGRVKPNTTGRREGGVIGLAKNQIAWVQNAETELIENPAKYLKRSLRDTRWDDLVVKAVFDEKPLSQRNVDLILRTYKNRVLRYRGQSIAQTELMASMSEGRRESLRQAVEKGRISDQDIEREWDASEDSSTRETHQAVNGTKIKGLNSRFSVGGHMLDGPHDPNGPAEETINCRCFERIRVDFIGLLAK